MTGEQPIDAVLGLDGTLLDFGDALVAESAARLGGSLRLRGALATPDGLQVDGHLDSIELRLGPRTFSTRGPTPITFVEGVF